MRKLAAVVTSTLVLGGLLGTAPAAWADHGDLEDFTVYAKITDFEKEDNGKEGWSEGDEISFEADLYEDRHERAGDADGMCEMLEVNKDDKEFEADCNVLFDLDDGELEVAGTIDEGDFEDHEITLPIKGGTGDYDAAEGDVTFEPLRHHAHHDGGHDEGHGHDGDNGDHRAPIIKVSVDFD